jgi:predicted methyltransferase
MLNPTWQSPNGEAKLWLGDCLDILPQLEPGSVDAVVTDPHGRPRLAVTRLGYRQNLFNGAILSGVQARHARRP